MAIVKSYDSRCYDLAAIFLGDEPGLHSEANIHALALEIQQTIEDEIQFMRADHIPDAVGTPPTRGK